jgi:hypothetical protein
MLPGDDIYEQVDRGIRLLCCSRRWWVDDEIDRAFGKECDAKWRSSFVVAHNFIDNKNGF